VCVAWGSPLPDRRVCLESCGGGAGPVFKLLAAAGRAAAAACGLRPGARRAVAIGLGGSGKTFC